jgi:cysteinyl-tRNA synthetase
MDFVLWKPSGPELPGWESPWGRGRPGWHIECSAMAYELLGASFDIHAGGIDLQFPHHENEIAQSACAHPEGGFASVWMHNEMLQVEGKKMSKSLGNFFTVRDLLDQGVPGEVIRFVMLSTHYGKPMDWTEKKRAEAEDEWFAWIRNLALQADILQKGVGTALPSSEVVSALADDLNTSLALTHLKRQFRHLISQEYLGLSETQQLRVWSEFVASVHLVGLPLLSEASRERQSILNTTLSEKDSLEYYSAIIAVELNDLTAARQIKDWVKADSIRDRLAAAGIAIQIGKDRIGYELLPDFDPTKLEGLAQ